MATFTPFYDLAKPAVNSPVDEDLWGDELNENMDKIDTALHTIATSGGASSVPVGAVLDYAGSAAPADFLLCYGQAVSRSTYSALFTAIGTTFGVGDGSTTFNLPDFRGRVGAGKDNMGGTSANRITTAASGIDGNTLGAAGGSQTHTLTTAQLAAHSHTGSTDSAGDHTHAIRVRNAGGADGLNKIDASTTLSGTTTGSFETNLNGLHSHTLTINNAGSGDAHNNVQPTIILNKIIKY